MTQATKSLGAAEAKSQFLSLIDDVKLKSRPVLVTKKGADTVYLIPAGKEDDPLAVYKIGGGRIVGDILSPADPRGEWELD